MKPTDIILFFKEVSNQAYEIEDAYSKSKGASTMRIPSVTVFLDEINTASCLGLFKEIIVDRSIDGTVSYNTYMNIHVYLWTYLLYIMCTCTHMSFFIIDMLLKE